MVEWDWLAANSLMMADHIDAKFVLERLCESLVRYLRRNPPYVVFAETLKGGGQDALRLRTGGCATVNGGEDERLVAGSDAAFTRPAVDKASRSPLVPHPLKEKNLDSSSIIRDALDSYRSLKMSCC
jgi:hypothetical protein